MSSLKDQIKKALEETTGFKNPDVEFASDPQFGDYSSSIALKNKDLNPEEIAKKINDQNLPFTATAVGKFINLWLKKDVLIDNLIQIDSTKENYGKSDLGKGKTWSIEHTSPNPNKAMHLGHLRNNVTGMTIANLAEACGYKVIRDCIDNDRGIAIAKLMWGYLKFARKDGKEMEDVDYWSDHQDEWQTPEDLNLRPDRFVDQLYVKGAADFDEDEAVEKEVRQMVVDWEAENPKNRALWKKVLNYSYQGQKLTLDRLGNIWDKVWHESDHYKKGKEMVDLGLKKGIFKKSEGAIVTDLTKYKLPDTVVIKKDGTALYITQDLALTKLKKETFRADKLFWVIGPEQSLAMQQMFAVCEQLGVGKVSDFTHLAYGYMSIKGQGKMSSRLGNVLYIDDLLDLAKENVKKIMKDERFSVEESENLQEEIGVGAVKYSILKVGRLQNMAFDINESVSVEGNSGPYLQYTTARTNSVLAKARSTKHEARNVSDFDIRTSDLSDEELMVLRTLSRFSEVIVGAAKSYSPNLLCNYLYDLASKYNTFYNKCPILTNSDQQVTNFRLSLTFGVGQVLKNGLKLLGIEAPERM